MSLTMKEKTNSLLYAALAEGVSFSEKQGDALRERFSNALSYQDAETKAEIIKSMGRHNGALMTIAEAKGYVSNCRGGIK